MKDLIEKMFDAIDAEILWCADNPDKKLSADYQLGFMRGLSQVKKIIGEMRINDFSN